MSEVEVGSVLARRYRVEAKLGEGGMAAVYRAFDLQRHVPLALKLLKADYAEDVEFIRKFKYEARSLQRLQHPNIVRFYELVDDGDVAFMVLDFIDRPMLRKVARQLGRPLMPGELLGYLRPICAALSYAHSEHVIHCDMKPANVMIDSAGKVSVNDFGIARLSESATVTFSTPGTAAYMAPEQWRGGEDVHPATDVYALGVMLYEFLTAQLPFTGSSVHGGGHTREKVMREHMSLEPPHASRINPQLPAMFDPVLRRCLEKDHAARYPNVGALLTDFEATCRTLGWPHTLEQSPPVVLPGSTTFDRPANQKQPISLSRLTRRPGLTVVGAGAAVLALVAVMLGSGRGTTQSNGLPTQNMASPALANVQRPTSQAEPSATLAPTPTSAIVPTLIATSIPTPACLDAPERRLSIGGRARVTYTTGLPSRVREAPGLSGRILGQAAEGTRMEILDGPECSDIGWWWWVKTANNVTGWMLEGVPEAYYLEPIP